MHQTLQEWETAEMLKSLPGLSFCQLVVFQFLSFCLRSNVWRVSLPKIHKFYGYPMTHWPKHRPGQLRIQKISCMEYMPSLRMSTMHWPVHTKSLSQTLQELLFATHAIYKLPCSLCTSWDCAICILQWTYYCEWYYNAFVLFYSLPNALSVLKKENIAMTSVGQ